ncbi:MAG: putative Ig domain-containing protein [Steroidobacteraceae bacterium]
MKAALLGKGTGSILLAVATAVMASGCMSEGADKPDGNTPLEIVGSDGNRAPQIAANPAQTVDEGDPYEMQASATDADGDPLMFQVQGLPQWARFDKTSGRMEGSPTVADVGQSADIIVSVSDGKVEKALDKFRIAVRPRKGSVPVSVPGTAAPVISGTPATTATVAAAYSFKATATDADSASLTFAIANKPEWASFSTTTGTLAGTPGTANAKTYSNILISVTDGKSSAALPAFAVTVQAAANRAPSIAGLAIATATVGQAYSFKPTASDPDGNALGYSITNKPTWATFNTSTGALTGTPAANAIGSYANIVIAVSDGKATSALTAFTLTVQGGANGSPVISGSPASNTNVGGSYSFQPTASDPNGDALTFSISGKPSWATFDAATGKLTGSPAASAVGSYANILITASDGSSSVALPAFSINVVQIASGSATLSWTPPTQNSDGSALSNLAGYRIYYGASAGSMTNQVTISNAGLTSYVIANLASGTHYFGITAYTSGGVEGPMSNVGSKTVM